MSITEAARLLVVSDADGGLRISPSGPLADPSAVADLDDAVGDALAAGAPRVEIDLRDVSRVDHAAKRVLAAGAAAARALGIELRVTGVR